MKQFIVAALIVVSFVSLLPLQAQAITLVPCGRSDQQPPRKEDGSYDVPPGQTLEQILQGYPDAECQLGHLFVLIIRTINYLISMAALVAMYFIINAGFGMVIALGNPEKIQTNKEAIQHAVIGFAIVILAFVFVNLLVNGIFGNTTAARRWWEPGCLFDLNNNEDGCPELRFSGPLAQQAPVPGTGNRQITYGTCTGIECADATLNICAPQAPTDRCNLAAGNRYDAQIRAGAAKIGQICQAVDTVKLLKAIVDNESDGRAGVASAVGSFGLFQLQPGTATLYKSRCGVPDNVAVDRAWLTNAQNIEAQACMAAAYLDVLETPCGCDVRQLAAGYNGGGSGRGACEVSANCGPSAGSGSCSACGDTSRPTKRWECLWDDNAHQQCNANRVGGSFRETRVYAPRVEYCYARY